MEWRVLFQDRINCEVPRKNPRSDCLIIDERSIFLRRIVIGENAKKDGITPGSLKIIFIGKSAYIMQAQYALYILKNTSVRL